MRIGVLLLSAALVPLACHQAPVPEGQTDLFVDGREVLVVPSLVRDFMPSVPARPDGGPLMLYVRLQSADSLALPSGLSATRAWVVDGSLVWETGLERDPAWTPAYGAGFHAFDGPKWGPNIYVDVTVQVERADRATWFVRVPRCLIETVL
jgi:hypothetical protein